MADAAGAETVESETVACGLRRTSFRLSDHVDICGVGRAEFSINVYIISRCRRLRERSARLSKDNRFGFPGERGKRGEEEGEFFFPLKSSEDLTSVPAAAGRLCSALKSVWKKEQRQDTMFVSQSLRFHFHLSGLFIQTPKGPGTWSSPLKDRHFCSGSRCSAPLSLFIFFTQSLLPL